MTIFHLIDERVPIPVITPLAAGIGSSLLTLTYVGGIYLSNHTRIGSAKDKDGVLLTRDDPVIIKSRLKRVSATTLASFIATGAFIKQAAFSREPTLLANLSTLRLLGLPLPVPSLLHSNILPFKPSLTLYTFHHVIPAIVIPFLLTSTFYLGTVYTSALDGNLPFQRNFSLKSSVYPIFNNVYGLRNNVIGPLTEEIVFRGCVLPLHILAGVGIKKTIFLTPFYFGIAHVHHAYEMYVNGGRTREALKNGLITAAAQFTYTFLFAWYANFMFLRTGSLLPGYVAHALCNRLGLPSPLYDVQRYPNRKWLIYAAHAVGAIGFASLLGQLTSPGFFGGSVFWR